MVRAKSSEGTLVVGPTGTNTVIYYTQLTVTYPCDRCGQPFVVFSLTPDYTDGGDIQGMICRNCHLVQDAVTRLMHRQCQLDTLCVEDHGHRGPCTLRLSGP